MKVLITGGACSGKSQFAAELALKMGGPVLFVATAESLDGEMAKRIKEHRKLRPPEWITLEASRHVGSRINQSIGNTRVVIIDCITLLISNVFNDYRDYPEEKLAESAVEEDCLKEIGEILSSMKENNASFIIVTNEVGEGLVPVNAVGRLYRDILGKANQVLARECERVYFMVSGIPLRVKPPCP